MANDRNALVPASVTVAFRKAIAGALVDGRYPITVTLTSLAIPEYTDTVGHEGSKTYRSTAVATFASPAATVPTNQAALEALTQQVARDWYGWQLAQTDVLLAGPVPWDKDAFSDRVEWIHTGGEENPKIATRIRRPPLNDWTEELMHCLPAPAGSGAPVDPDDPSEAIWARLTGHNSGYAHSWIKVRRIPPTPGSYATISGTNFEDDPTAGLSGLFNAYERNRFPNVPIDSWVKLTPWGNNKWVFDYEYDHFPARVVSEIGDGSYTVRSQYPLGSDRQNARLVTATEFNATTGIPEGTKVKVWVYRVGENLEYWFDHPLPDFGCDIQPVGCEPDCGESTLAAREDHVHDYTFGDDIQPTNCEADPGEDCLPARADHVHDLTFGTDVQPVGSANSPGDDCLPARVDHVHAFTWPTCSPVVVYETTVACEGGLLKVYFRGVSLNVVNGCLTASAGDWEFSHVAGCCDCESGEGVETPCCELPISTSLTISITGKSGACTCLPDEVDMVYGGLNLSSDHFWSAILGVSCANPSSLTLTCTGGNWRLTGTNLGTNLAPDNVTCDPFELTFDALDGSGICSPPSAGGFSLTITESA